MYKYFILIMASSLLYYLIFKYKYDKKWKKLAFVVSVGAMLASIGSIMEELFPLYKHIISNIFAILMFIAIIIMFYLLIPMAWSLRKDPEKKIMAYAAFTITVLTVIFFIIMVTLIQLGIFKN